MATLTMPLCGQVQLAHPRVGALLARVLARRPPRLEGTHVDVPAKLLIQRALGRGHRGRH
eukprot:scaffold52334_cov57-Phaeocystis_antarctica.AAC.2